MTILQSEATAISQPFARSLQDRLLRIIGVGKTGGDLLTADRMRAGIVFKTLLSGVRY
jgi:hypothetical protein